MADDALVQRIGPVDPEHLRPDQERVFSEIAGTRGRVAGPFGILLHSPELADRVQALGSFLRWQSSLGADLTELAVLVTAKAWSSDFEWSAHEPHARRAGLTDAEIDGIRAAAWVADRSTPERTDVYVYAHELATTGDVSDATYRQTLTRLGEIGLVELTVVVGYYTLLAMTLNAHRVAAAPPPPPTA